MGGDLVPDFATPEARLLFGEYHAKAFLDIGIMDNWQRLEAKCREILGWRMQLIPCLCSSFDRYAADGTPPFRALLLDSPNDPAILNVDDEYMIGDRLRSLPEKQNEKLCFLQASGITSGPGKPFKVSAPFKAPFVPVPRFAAGTKSAGHSKRFPVHRYNSPLNSRSPASL
jgi:hypothetical protein